MRTDGGSVASSDLAELMTNVVLNGKFLSASPTGVHRVAHELANALAKLADERHMSGPEVWIPWDGAQQATEMALPVRCVGPLRSIAWEQLTLPLRAGSRRLILNLCNIAPMLARNAVTMIHDAQVHISPASYGRGFRLWYKFVQPIIARRHRHILTVSEYSRGQLVAAGLATPERISVVHNGVDHILATSADPSIVTRLGLATHGYVVALASTQAHKNIGLLLYSFTHPALMNLKLVLIGSANAADFRVMGTPPSPNVIFAGRVSDAELRGLYEQALCLAFPSTTEGFGLPPMEAMLVGCPAIVAPCGALPEICGDAAIYADAGSPSEWVDAIINIANDPALRAKRADIGIRRARLFTWRKAAERLCDILAYNAK